MLLRTPKLLWGAAFANTIEVESIDNAIAYSDPRGDEYVKNGAGTEEAAIEGHDQILECDVPYIHTATGDNINSVTATGWDGAAGWRAALEWLRAKNVGRWYPDRTSGTFQSIFLVDPLRGSPAIEADGTRRLRLKIRTTDDSPFTGY